eukprot:COSAG05_NODE_2399_length_3111_cov_58.711819_4_plen_144_part_00
MFIYIIGDLAPCSVQSGYQKLVLRRNGLVSLSTTRDPTRSATQEGTLTTQPFHLPNCHVAPGRGGNESSSLTLQLNIATSIGLGARVQLRSVAGDMLGDSETIMGGGTAYEVQWTKPPANTTRAYLHCTQCALLLLRLNCVLI